MLGVLRTHRARLRFTERYLTSSKEFASWTVSAKTKP